MGSPFSPRRISGRQWLGVVWLGLYVSLRGPSHNPMFSERNRIRCIVLPLGGGWRIVLRRAKPEAMGV